MKLSYCLQREILFFGVFTVLPVQERAAHFVALIPFVSDTAVFAGTCDLWATSEVPCYSTSV